MSFTASVLRLKLFAGRAATIANSRIMRNDPFSPGEEPGRAAAAPRGCGAHGWVPVGVCHPPHLPLVSLLLSNWFRFFLFLTVQSNGRTSLLEDLPEVQIPNRNGRFICVRAKPRWEELELLSEEDAGSRSSCFSFVCSGKRGGSPPFPGLKILPRKPRIFRVAFGSPCPGRPEHHPPCLPPPAGRDRARRSGSPRQGDGALRAGAPGAAEGEEAGQRPRKAFHGGSPPLPLPPCSLPG